MANKKSKKGQVPVTDTVAPIVSNMVELTANNGSLNKYGKRNLIAHGRHAQGGQIDQQAFKSFITGKPVTFEDCVKQNLTEAVSNALTPSRIDAHLQHLVGKHGFKVLIDPVKKMFQVTGVGTLSTDDVKTACDIL
jgi:hypothetical protein